MCADDCKAINGVGVTSSTTGEGRLLDRFFRSLMASSCVPQTELTGVRSAKNERRVVGVEQAKVLGVGRRVVVSGRLRPNASRQRGWRGFYAAPAALAFSTLRAAAKGVGGFAFLKVCPLASAVKAAQSF